MKTYVLAIFVAASMAIGITACGSGGKTYDIAPVFPLDSGKCAKYNGDQEGSGPTESCMVSKDDCERASADWNEAMESGAVYDAIEFSCD